MLHEHVPMDPGMIEAQTDLLNAISLQLWLIKMLQDGRVDDEQFIKMHREYEVQMDQLISQRKEMLEEAQNLDLIRDLNEVKIYYDELKKKRELGIISEEEYKVKARSFDWEINNLNEEIYRQEAKIELLKDVLHGKPLEEVINTRTKAEDYKKALGSLKISGDVGQEVIIVANESLDKILNYFKEFGEVNHEPEVSVTESIEDFDYLCFQLECSGFSRTVHETALDTPTTRSTREPPTRKPSSPRPHSLPLNPIPPLFHVSPPLSSSTSMAHATASPQGCPAEPG